jgi:hypothetical protein
MKKLFMGMIGSCFLLFTAQAQEQRVQKDKKHHRRHHQELAQLNLSDNQKEQLKLQREQTGKQLRDLEKNDGITVKEYREKKLAIKKQQKENLNNLLTDEQRNQLAKQQSDKKASFGYRGDSRMEQMKTKLNLSQEQVESLKASRAARQAAMKSIRENEKLSDSEKQAQYKMLKEQYKTDLNKVLNADQLMIMENHKKNKKGTIK